MKIRAEDMAELARCLCAVGGRDSETARIALAWLARNLAAKQGLTGEDCCAFVRRLTGVPRGTGRPDFSDARFCLTFSLLCEVWAGSVADPTEGAVEAHRHDEAPAWADEAVPTALIGSWVFYRAV